MDVINVHAPSWYEPESYGRVAHGLADGLAQLGAYINRYGVNPPKQPLRLTTGGFLLGYPTFYKQYGAFSSVGLRIGLTMFESTLLPDGWVDSLNTLDAVMTPSVFCKQMFIANGVTVPIHVNPLGIDPAFTFRRRPPLKNRPLRILAIGDRGWRKGWHTAGFIVNTAFGMNNMDVELTYKIRTQKGFVSAFENTNFKIAAGDYTNEQLADFYGQFDIMLAPFCGEGFGWPPREFAATGGLVLATNWSGLSDQIERWAIPLNTYQMVDAWMGDPQLEGHGQWAEVDIGVGAKTLKQAAGFIYSGWNESDVPLKVSEFVRQFYTWQGFAAHAYHIWNNTHASNRFTSRTVFEETGSGVLQSRPGIH